MHYVGKAHQRRIAELTSTSDVVGEEFNNWATPEEEDEDTLHTNDSAEKVTMYKCVRASE